MEEIEEMSFKEIRFEAFLIFIKSVLKDVYKQNRNMNAIKALILMINEELLEIEKKSKDLKWFMEFTAKCITAKNTSTLMAAGLSAIMIKNAWI